MCFLDETDESNPVLVRIADNALQWNAGHGSNRGWMVVCCPVLDDNVTEKIDGTATPWMMGHNMFGQSYKHYQNNPDPSVHVSTNPKSFHDDGNWNFSSVDPLDPKAAERQSKKGKPKQKRASGKS